jgi:hypothetical protein
MRFSQTSKQINEQEEREVKMKKMSLRKQKKKMGLNHLMEVDKLQKSQRKSMTRNQV